MVFVVSVNNKWLDCHTDFFRSGSINDVSDMDHDMDVEENKIFCVCSSFYNVLHDYIFCVAKYVGVSICFQSVEILQH